MHNPVNAAEMPHRFEVGALVHLADSDGRGHRRMRSAVWRVMAWDTNRTPVRDPEPAYALYRPQAGYIRYAYESDLVPA